MSSDLNNKNLEASKEFMKLKDAYDGLLSEVPKQIVKKLRSSSIRNNIGRVFDSVLGHFREIFNFSVYDSFGIYNETVNRKKTHAVGYGHTEEIICCGFEETRWGAT